MRIGKGGGICSRDEESEEDVLEGSTTCPSNPRLTLINPLVERNLVWGEYNHWAQASLKYPIVAQTARKYLCIPASSAKLERNFSKARYIVRARQARLSYEHVNELSFLFWNQDLMY